MAKIHVTLALMVLSRLFGLPELVRARASSGKLKKVFCKFTDVRMLQDRLRSLSGSRFY